MRKTIMIGDILAELNDKNLTKSLTIASYNDHNEKTTTTFRVEKDDVISLLGLKYYERRFLENPYLTNSGMTYTNQFVEFWDRFMSQNHDRFNKIGSLLMTEYNPLNNYEGHSYLTNEIGERKTDFENDEVKVTNVQGARHNESKDYTSAFESTDATIPSSKAINDNQSATDSTTTDAFGNSSTTHETTDSTTEFKFGNLGAATTMDMIAKELKQRTYNLVEFIVAEFINEISIY